MDNGERKHVVSDDLLYCAEKKHVNMGLSLEGYPNRDSVKYFLLQVIILCIFLYFKQKIKVKIIVQIKQLLKIIKRNSKILWIQYDFKFYESLKFT